MRYRVNGLTCLLITLALGPVIALPALPADTIVEFTGASPGDDFGMSAEPAGDVNMDGQADILIGAPASDIPDDYAGSCYLFEGPFDHATVKAVQADAEIRAENFGDNLGVAVSSAGDVNGDGFTDILMGARGYDQPGIQSGRVYLFHGPVSGTLSVGQADAVFAGEEYYELGWALAANFDFNGDSIGDIAMGAPEADLVGNAHIFFGPFSGMQSTTDADLTIVGAIVFEELGQALAVGDFNDDGIDDFAIGGPGSNFGTAVPGRVYIFLGPKSGTFSASTADVILQGEADLDHFGISIDVGDLNGDGSDDLVVGADQEFGVGTGKCYVFYGPLLEAFSTDANADAVIVSEPSADIEPRKFGAAVASAGDVDCDGFDDLLIGDPWANDLNGGGVHSGVAYLFHGPLSGTISSLQADRNFVGAPSDQMGDSVAGAGDIDGNGVDDYLIGAPSDSYSDTEAGRTLLVLSQRLGDLDYDGDVDLFDLGQLLANYGVSSGAAYEDGDLDGDGDVDLSDLGALLAVYGSVCG
jgi:hypothetical protein